MSIITYMDYIGVVAFAISGAFIAIQKRMDIFGIYILATVTAVGGGVMRDVVMNHGVPVFFKSSTTIFLTIAATAFAIAIRNVKRLQFLITVSDAVGLAVFAIDTGSKAINLGYGLPEFLFMSTITAVGGGVIRDLLSQRVPAVLRKDIYAVAAIIGSLFLWFTEPYIGLTVSTYLSIALVIAIRLFSIYFKINLPVFKITP
ncbi:MAG: trimeric intracellular cation channel family protein [Oscillospiraceae bacterium]